LSKIEELVKKVIAQVLCIKTKKIALTDSITKDIGADDLDWIEILINIEKEVGFDIPDKKALEMETVKDMVTYILPYIIVLFSQGLPTFFRTHTTIFITKITTINTFPCRYS